MQTGIQISSLKPLLTTPEQVRQAFAQVRALGCQTVQLQWIDPRVPAADIAGALRENGISSVGVQDLYEAVQNDFQYYVNLNAATGGRWFCVSRVPETRRSPAGLDAFAGELREMAQALKSQGQKLCFHPVGRDYEPVEGIVPVDYLLNALPDLPLCLDLYHLSRSGYAMPDTLRRLAGRVCMVHFKDGRGDELVPAGQGDMDWTGVVPACLDAGVAYAFVEQERWPGDPYVCLKAALDWLNGQLGEAAP